VFDFELFQPIDKYIIYAIIHILGELLHVKYTMKLLSGIGTLDRERITALLRGSKGTLTVQEAAKILAITNTEAAKLLSRWTAKGWFSRVKRGVYIPVPLESITADIPLEDPWIIAEKLYNPCYIGGFSAAEYWGLTEQIFSTIVVLTAKEIRDRHPVINGTEFWLRSISKEAIFGLKEIWRGQVKVAVSDPTRTIVDFLADPKLGGGIRTVVDMLNVYLKSDQKDSRLLIEYAKKLGNGAVIKRLGFLLAQNAPDENEVIEFCKKELTTGNVKLDPQLDGDKLVTRWRLWIPEDWVK
jgi:predicted transcriptional regulator of viral defense system